MNETLEKEVIQRIISYIETTEGFMVEQTPLYVQEYLNYGLMKNGIFTILIGVVLCVWVTLWTKCVIKHWKLAEGLDSDYEVTSYRDGVMLIGSVSGIVGHSVLILAFFDFLLRSMKYVVAPRVVVLEHLRNLL